MDEVCVQDTHIESKGNISANSYSKQPTKPKGNKFKGKGKGKQTTTIKKEGENPTCSHCKKGHDVSKC